MEKSKRQHRSSGQPRGQRKNHDDRDYQGRKSRHALRAPPPRESRSRSPTRSDKAGEGSPSNMKGNQGGFVMSWLQQAYPHRNHPPDLEDDRTPSVAQDGRIGKKKRPRPPSERLSPSPEKRQTKRDSFEKRPRHKTRHDKYDYKDGLDRDKQQPKDRRKTDSRKRQHNEREQTSSTQQPLPLKNQGNHRKAIKAVVVRKALDSDPRDPETSLDLQEKPSRSRRPRESKTQRKKFDKDIQDMSGFFGRKSGGHVVRPSLRRQPRTPQNPQREDDLSDNSPSHSHSHSSSPDIDEPKRRSHPSGVTRGDRHTKWIRSIGPSTVNGTANTTNEGWEYFDEPKADLVKRTKHGEKGTTRPSRDRDRNLISSRKRERSRADEPRGHEARSDRRFDKPQPMIQDYVNATMPLGDYGDQYFHSQRPLIDGRYLLMNQDQALRAWAPGPSVSFAHRPTEWLPIQRGTGAPPLDHGYNKNWQMSRTRSMEHGVMSANVNVPYLAQVTPTDFGPYLERRHSLGTTVPHNATYPLAEPSLAPVSYGHAEVEPREAVSIYYTEQSYQPMLEQANRPMTSYDLGLQGASFRPDHSDRYMAAPRPSKKLKRMREDYVEKLEREAFGTLEPSNDTDCMDFHDEEHLGVGVSIQPAQDLSGGNPDDSTGENLVLQEGKERSTADAAHLSHVSSSLLPLTHGFTHLASPPPSKDVRMSFYGID